MSQYFKIVYVRKQVTTDYLPGGSTRETVREIEETMTGLPGSTVANYRKVLGDQLKSVEVDYSSEGSAERGKRPQVKTGERKVQSRKISGPAAAAVEDAGNPYGMSYAGIVNKMVEKEKAA